MAEKKNFKEWVKEHKEEIKAEVKTLFGCAAGFGLGYFMASKLTAAEIEIGLQKLRADGILKLFNPETGVEITVKELGNIVNNTNK